MQFLLEYEVKAGNSNTTEVAERADVGPSVAFLIVSNTLFRSKNIYYIPVPHLLKLYSFTDF
jgi:hypothetical protein